MSAEISEEIFVVLTPSEVDLNRIVFKDAETQTFRTGTSSTCSNAFYRNDEDQEAALFIKAPAQNTFGASYKYDMAFKVKPGESFPDKAKGAQIFYPMTSLETIKKPTKEEKAFIDLIDGLWNLAIQAGEVEAQREQLLIPRVSKTSYVAASAEGNMRDFIKYPIQPGKPKPDDKSPRPDNMYINLITRGIGNEMRVQTKVYGPGDTLLPLEGYLNTRGRIEPCLKFEGIYWGAHGQQPYGGSLRFRVAEANFTPAPGFSNGIPKGRLLGGGSAAGGDQPIVPVPARRGPPPTPSEGDDPNPLEAILKPPPAKSAPKPVVKQAPKKAAPTVLKKAAAPKPKPKPAPVEPDPVEEGNGEEEAQ